MPTPEHTNGKTQRLLISIIVLLTLILLGGTFFVGVRVGEHKSSARALHHFRKAGFPSDVIRDVRGKGNRGHFKRHGYGGEVLSISDESITIVKKDGSEGTIYFEEDTPVKFREEERSLSDVTIGQHVIAIGKPNDDGSIQATMLLLPPWQK